jgi:hypothetical protein
MGILFEASVSELPLMGDVFVKPNSTFGVQTCAQTQGKRCAKCAKIFNGSRKGVCVWI